MNPLLFKRTGIIMVAICVLMTNSSILLGQRDLGDMLVDSPIGSAAESAMKAIKRPTQVPSSYKARTLPPGRAMVSPTTGSAATPPQSRSTGNVAPGSTSLSDPRSAATISGFNPANKATTPNRSQITQAGYVDSNQGITADGNDPLIAQKKFPKNQVPPNVMFTPSSTGFPPAVRGAMTGLSGETATERLIQMQTQMQAQNAESLRENDEIRQQFTALQAKYKESQDQLQVAAREIQTARKALSIAKNDLDRVRNDVQALREKIRIAERDHAGFLQSMGPLLQQLLEAQDISALPPDPTE